MFTKYEIVHDKELGYAFRRRRFGKTHYLDLAEYRGCVNNVRWRHKEGDKFIRDCWIRASNDKHSQDPGYKNVQLIHRIFASKRNDVGAPVTDADIAMEKLQE